MSKDRGSVKDMLKVLSAVLALVLTTLYFAPLNLLLSNARELSISPSVALTLSWKLAFGFVALTVIGAAFLALDNRRILGCLILSIAAMFHIQGNLIALDYGLFDGDDINWHSNNAAGILEIILWLTLPAIAIRYRAKIWPHIHLLALLLVLMQASSLAFELLNGKRFPSEQASADEVAKSPSKPDFGLYDFSTERNVLIIITDTFGAPTLQEIVEDDPSYARQLSGFTFYRNTLGVSPYTLLSIPTILSSRVYENSGTIQSFMGESFNENSLPAVLQENGYKASVITMGLYKGYLQWLPSQNTTSVLDGKVSDARIREYLQLWDITLFRYAPHYLKMEIYSDHKWLLQTHILNPERQKGAEDVLFGSKNSLMVPTNVHQASRIIRDRFIERANTDSDSPTFKFIHLFTSHTPYLMNSDGTPLSVGEFESRSLKRRGIDQSKYALRQILDMLEKLRELEIYRDTLIIIAADHGSDLKNDSRAGFMRRSNPLLLIKPIDRDGDLRHSNAPTSLLDIPLTVSEALDIDTEFSGYPILDNEIPMSRVRSYYFFDWNSQGFWKADHLPQLEKYEINGLADDQGAWEKSCDLEYVEGGHASC